MSTDAPGRSLVADLIPLGRSIATAVRVLALVSEPGSIEHVVFPDLCRDELLD